MVGGREERDLAPLARGAADGARASIDRLLGRGGEATFRLGEEEVVVTGGNVVVSPAAVAHGFVNSGGDELRLTAIHGAGRFDTEWLEGDDPAWRSNR